VLLAGTAIALVSSGILAKDCTPKANANLAGCNFSGAHLQRIDLHGANLSNTDLSRANLTATSLRNANLSGSDLEGANFGGESSAANLHGANLPVLI
jgi:uncharacterized protein YjbI with pentapeptide repeats